MSDERPRILVIGAELDDETRERLSSSFRIDSVRDARDAVIALGGTVVDLDGDDLQRRIDAIDAAGSRLLDMDPNRIVSLDMNARIAEFEKRVGAGMDELFGWDNFEVRVLDPRSGKLELIAYRNIQPLSIGVSINVASAGNGITGWVAASGRSYVCRDSNVDPLYLAGLTDARSSLTVPLQLRDRVVGVLNVESEMVDHFSEIDRLSLELYARYVAQTVNLLDMLRVERSTTNKRILDTITDELDRPLGAIEAVAEELRTAAGENDRLRAGVARLVNELDRLRSSVRTCTAGPQRVLGAERALLDAGPDPLLSGRRVLVADDEPSIRQTIRSVLESRGALVTVATNGSDAIASLRDASEHDEAFDLVVSDVRMPDRNGYEVFRASKDVHADTPVILMTGFGYDPHHSIVRSSQEGLHCFLFKPFQVEQLLEEVHKALASEA